MLRRLVEASLLTLPVYAALALYALGLRVAQYGWTLDRFWAVLVALATAGYAVGYALAVLRRQRRWLQMLEPVNRWMCWAVLALALLGNSPLLDPVRLTLSSQLERLRGPAGDHQQRRQRAALRSGAPCRRCANCSAIRPSPLMPTRHR